MRDPESDPPTDEASAPAHDAAKPLTRLQGTAILAAFALVAVLSVLALVLFHVGGPLLVAMGAPEWAHFAAPVAAFAIILFALLAVRALRKALRRKIEALGLRDRTELPKEDGQGRQ
jgi:hypothetical protein